MEQTIPAASASVLGMPSFFGLVGESFGMYGRKWKSLFKIIFASFGFIALAVVTGVLLAVVFGTVSAANIGVAIAIGIIAAIAAIIGCIYVSVWFGAAIIVVLTDNQDNIGFGAAMKRARPYINSYFEVSILSGLIALLGFVLFFIPGIIFSIWYMFSRYLVFTDNEKGIMAISKSREYARGYFGKIFLLSLLGGILMFVWEMMANVIPFVGPIINVLLITPMSLIYSYLIFSHLRKIKGPAINIISTDNQNLTKILAGLGTIVLLLGIGLVIAFAPQIKSYYETELPKYQSQSGSQLPPIPQRPI